MRTQSKALESTTQTSFLSEPIQSAFESLQRLSFVGICARIAFLFLAGTAAIHVLLLEESAELMGFGTLVDVDAEANLPT